MKFIKKNMKKIVIVLVVLLIIVGVCLYVFTRNDKEVIRDLSVTYVDGNKVKFKNIESGYSTIKEIEITNNNKEYMTYKLSWSSIENTFTDQNKLLYTIEGTGEHSGSLGTSQLPVAASKVFTSVVIMSGETHKYKVKIDYDGTDTEGFFEGKLKVEVNGVNGDGDEQMEKEAQEREEELTGLDNKI